MNGKRKNLEGCTGYEESACCGGRLYDDSDICGSCKEHSDTCCSDCDDICEDYETKY